jgi:hypothetical protein
MASKKKQLEIPVAAPPAEPGTAAWTRYKLDEDDGDEVWVLLWDGGEVATIENRPNGEGWTARIGSALGTKYIHCESREAAFLWAERLVGWAVPVGPTRVVRS